MDFVTDELRRALADRYELLRELGRGGMAIEYLARDREIDIDPSTNEFIARSAASQAGERIIIVTGWFDELRKRFAQATAR